MDTNSEGLGPAVHQAIQEHLTAAGGGMVTSLYCIVEFIDADGEPAWMYATADDQRMGTTMGLIEWARGIAQYELRRYLDDMDD